MLIHIQFGLIGSSDTHNSGGSITENNYSGKFNALDGTPSKRLAPDETAAVVRFKYMSAAGLAGVWASENSRDAIFDAMKNKETFATSGTRIQLRMFAGDQLNKISMDEEDWMEGASANGTNMGGVLPVTSNNPTFLVWASKDPDGAHLDRIQMIKTWIDADGQTHEKIFDIAWEEGRTKNEDGTLAAIGNTVNVPDASYTNTIGSVELKAQWQDPEFNPNQSAQYFYARLRNSDS